MHPSGRGSTLVALALLLTLSLVPGTAGQEDFEMRGRQRLGDPEAAPPYLLELWTTLDTERIREQNLPEFRFELFWRGNGTPVAPGPDLLLFAFACAPPDTDDTVCDPAMQEATEVGSLLIDADDGSADGTYVWEPTGRVFDTEGEWAIEVTLAEHPGNNTALFLFGTTELPSAPSFVTDGLRYLFGAEGGVAARVGIMLVWVAVFVLIGRGFTILARRTFLTPARVDPTVGRLALRLFGAIWAIVAVAWTLWVVWRINFWAGLTALGLLSVALGFGMQNTVANLMGGINLASDKPFVVGDRIQVGESWGDVQEIGLRSTKIITPRKELVIIPNKLLDEREIWNYTRDHQELRLDIDVGISYDADRRLAEALMTLAATEHPAILDYPRPRVLLMGFGEFSINLQLRCWLQAAKDARIVSSDLRKMIQDKFNAEGIEIPFPYRTLVNKADLPPARRATNEELEGFTTTAARLPKMLYATAGPSQIHSIAEFVGRIAKELDVVLVVLYVTPPGKRVPRSEEYRVMSAFKDAATHHTIAVKTIHREGHIVETIKQVIQDENIDLVGIGAHRQGILPSPRKVADFTKEIRESVHIPVLIVPPSLEISQRTLNHYRGLIEERHLSRERKKSGIVTDKETSEETKENEEIGSGLPPRRSAHVTHVRHGADDETIQAMDDLEGLEETEETEEEEEGEDGDGPTGRGARR